MRVTLRSKDFSLVEGAKQGIETALKTVESLFSKDTIFNVYIVKRTKDYKCEIKVQCGHDFIRSEETGKSVELSINNAISTLKKRVRKVKSLKITKKRGHDVLSIKQINTNMFIDDRDELIDFKIERRKDINAESFTEEEAVLQLESLNHTFYVFRNKDLHDAICVMYRRSVGYGVIEVN